MKPTEYTHTLKNVTQDRTHQKYYLKKNIFYFKK